MKPITVQASPNASQAIGQPNSRTGGRGHEDQPDLLVARPDQQQADREAAGRADRLTGHQSSRCRRGPGSRPLSASAQTSWLMTTAISDATAPRRPARSLRRAQQPISGDRPGEDRGRADRQCLEEMPRPVRGHRLGEDACAGDRPQPARDQPAATPGTRDSA